MLNPIGAFLFRPFHAILSNFAKAWARELQPVTVGAPSCTSNLLEMPKDIRWVQPHFWRATPGQSWECWACHLFNANHLPNLPGSWIPATTSIDIESWAEHCESHNHVKALEYHRKLPMFSIPRCNLTRNWCCPECQFPISDVRPEYLQVHWHTECSANPYNTRRMRRMYEPYQPVYVHVSDVERIRKGQIPAGPLSINYAPIQYFRPQVSHPPTRTMTPSSDESSTDVTPDLTLDEDDSSTSTTLSQSDLDLEFPSLIHSFIMKPGSKALLKKHRRSASAL